VADGKLVIVTCASQNHARPLLNLLASIDRHEPATPVVVYDLGLSEATLEALRERQRRILPFRFNDYPPHIDADNLRTYAWKPVLVHETLRREGVPLLYLDAGDLLHAPLARVRAELDRIGLYCPVSTGTIRSWCHPATLEAMTVEPAILDDRMRNAAIIGFGSGALARELAERWYECALRPEIICPPGATVKDGHRFDQSVLSILMARARRSHGLTWEDTALDISIHNDRFGRREARYYMKRPRLQSEGRTALKTVHAALLARARRRKRLPSRLWRALKRSWRAAHAAIAAR
jgi:hypothetical protein